MVRGAFLEKTVVVAVGAGRGLHPVVPRARGFHVTDSGITVVGKGMKVPS